jgi:hypothetical protein
MLCTVEIFTYLVQYKASPCFLAGTRPHKLRLFFEKFGVGPETGQPYFMGVCIEPDQQQVTLDMALNVSGPVA